MKYLSIWISYLSATIIVLLVDRVFGVHTVFFAWILGSFLTLTLPRQRWGEFIACCLYDVGYTYIVGTSALLVFVAMFLFPYIQNKLQSRTVTYGFLVFFLSICMSFFDRKALHLDSMLFFQLFLSIISTIIFYVFFERTKRRGKYL